MTKRLLASERKVGEIVEAVGASSYQLGVANGLRRAAGELQERAGNLFMEKKDEEARLLRMMSDMLKRMEVEAQQVYTSQFQTRHTDALEEVSKLDRLWDNEVEKGRVASGDNVIYRPDGTTDFKVSNA